MRNLHDFRRTNLSHRGILPFLLNIYDALAYGSERHSQPIDVCKADLSGRVGQQTAGTTDLVRRKFRSLFALLTGQPLGDPVSRHPTDSPCYNLQI